MEVLKVTIGAELLPIATKFFEMISGGLGSFLGDTSKLDAFRTSLQGIKKEMKDAFSSEDVQTTLSNMKAGFSSFGTSFKIGDLFGDMKAGASNAFSGVMNVFSKLDFKSFGANMGSGLNSLKQAFGTLGTIIGDVLGKVDWNGVLQGAGLLFNVISKVINILVQVLGPIIKVVLGGMVTAFNQTVQIINVILTVVKVVFSAIGSYLNWAKSVWIGVWNAISSFFSGVWATIKSVVSIAIFMVCYKFNEIRAKAGEVISGVKQFFVDGFNTAKTTVAGAIDGIKTKIGEIIAKVGEIVTKVKEAFSPSNWKLPDIKLPNLFGGADGRWTGDKSYKGGTTWVGERGKELIQQPGQLPFVANNPMLMNLKAGTKILNNTDTRSMLKSKAETYKDKFKESRAGKLLSNVTGTTKNTNNSTSTTTTTSNDKTDNRVINNKPVINVTINNYSNTDIRAEVEKVFNDIIEKMLILKGEID